MKRFAYNLGAIIAGGMLPFAFAPCSYYPVAIISLTMLFLIWNKATKAAWYGWLFGIGFFGMGISWIYISIHTYGNAPKPLAVIITALFIMFLALFPALQGYLYTKYFSKNNLSKHLLAAPALWVLLEWFRSWLLTGFPWLFLGYSQTLSPLNHLAPIFGVYGVSFAVALTAAGITRILLEKDWIAASQKAILAMTERNWIAAGYRVFLDCRVAGSTPRNEVPLAMTKRNWITTSIKFFWEFKQLVIILITITTLWLGSVLLGNVTWTEPTGDEFSVSIIQGNIPQTQKWQTRQLKSILNHYADLTTDHWHSKLIIWPEAAIPTFPEQVKNYLHILHTQARKQQSTVIAGAPIFIATTGKYYNGIIAFGEHKHLYLKRHLVPFGEYVPLKKTLSWLRHFLIIPMSGFSSGPLQQPDFIAANINIAPFICYEIAYPNLVLTSFPKAQLIVTVSDDSWFGESNAAQQHLEMAQMRSLETGRYQLLSSNTGISAIIDPHGKIMDVAPEFQTATLTKMISAMTGSTPWINYGKYMWPTLAIIFLLLGLVQQRRGKNKQP